MRVKKIKGLKPLLTKGETLWVSDGYRILKTIDRGNSFKEVVKYRASIKDRLKSVSNLSRRLFRMGFHGLNELPDGSLIGLVRGKIIKCGPSSKEFNTVFTIPRGSRPLNICNFPDGRLFFGEYFSNEERKEVNIYGSYDYGETWQVVHTFPEGSVRHVHGIYYDFFRKGAWILTGDIEDECRILFTGDGFKNVSTELIGTQMYRAVAIIPMENGLIIPTDTPLEQNYIQLYDINSKTIKRVQNIEGSAFYTLECGGTLLVSTVVEPSDINKTKYAKIYISKDGESWRELYSQKKDVWHLKYFQYGSLILPQGLSGDSVIYAYGQGVQKDDGYLLIFEA
ncbi:hypothetical protein [Halobacillus massiliensis]|uniref:hypothetical protein n=1 Tax=Halobacillus massiliensis TaxID=1926286 RepID=UPI0009E60A8C|nr:hypothetical protein [Halobacillus massiliensis]